MDPLIFLTFGSRDWKWDFTATGCYYCRSRPVVGSLTFSSKWVRLIKEVPAVIKRLPWSSKCSSFHSGPGGHWDVVKSTHYFWGGYVPFASQNIPWPSATHDKDYFHELLLLMKPRMVVRADHRGDVRRTFNAANQDVFLVCIIWTMEKQNSVAKQNKQTLNAIVWH